MKKANAKDSKSRMLQRFSLPALVLGLGRAGFSVMETSMALGIGAFLVLGIGSTMMSVNKELGRANYIADRSGLTNEIKQWLIVAGKDVGQCGSMNFALTGSAALSALNAANGMDIQITVSSGQTLTTGATFNFGNTLMRVLQLRFDNTENLFTDPLTGQEFYRGDILAQFEKADGTGEPTPISRAGSMILAVDSTTGGIASCATNPDIVVGTACASMIGYVMDANTGRCVEATANYAGTDCSAGGERIALRAQLGGVRNLECASTAAVRCNSPADLSVRRALSGIGKINPANPAGALPASSNIVHAVECDGSFAYAPPPAATTPAVGTAGPPGAVPTYTPPSTYTSGPNPAVANCPSPDTALDWYVQCEILRQDITGLTPATCPPAPAVCNTMTIPTVDHVAEAAAAPAPVAPAAASNQCECGGAPINSGEYCGALTTASLGFLHTSYQVGVVYQCTNGRLAAVNAANIQAPTNLQTGVMRPVTESGGIYQIN
ncbi:MAG: hypothetical protein ABL860_05845 [Candidatus Nitrotoga sp.]